MSRMFEAHVDPLRRRVKVVQEIPGWFDGVDRFIASPVGTAGHEEVFTVEPGEEPPTWLSLPTGDAIRLRDALNAALPPAASAAPAPSAWAETNERLVRIIEHLAAPR